MIGWPQIPVGVISLQRSAMVHGDAARNSPRVNYLAETLVSGGLKAYAAIKRLLRGNKLPRLTPYSVFAER